MFIEGVNGMIDTINEMLPDSFKIGKFDVPKEYVSEREGKKSSDIRKREAAAEKPAVESEEDKKKRYYDIYVNDGPDAMSEAMDADIMAKPEDQRTREEKAQLYLSQYSKSKDSADYVLQPKPEQASAVTNQSSDVAAAKEDQMSAGSKPTIVSAPTVNNVSNNTTNQSVKLPTRNSDNTVSRYLGSKFAF